MPTPDENGPLPDATREIRQMERAADVAYTIPGMMAERVGKMEPDARDLYTEQRADIVAKLENDERRDEAERRARLAAGTMLPEDDPGAEEPTKSLTGRSARMTIVDEVAAPAIIVRKTIYLPLDTETSGLPLYTEVINGKKTTVPADDPRQPRLAQAYMGFVDENMDLIREFDGYVKPDGWHMEPGASKVNGLTDEFLMEHGRPIAEILDVYEEAIAEGVIVVAHNAQFDCKIMRGELRRAKRSDHFEATKQFCTMRGWSAAKGGGWQKFDNLCDLLSVEHKDHHRATGDGRALLGVMRHFRRLEIPIVGKVHESKYHPNRDKEASGE